MELHMGQQFPQDRYRILFESSSDPHLILDETGITDCNAATVELLRATSRSQILAVHPGALSPTFQPDGRPSLEKAADMMLLARELGCHRFEWTHRKLDGEAFPVEVSLNSVEIDGKQAYIVVWHDLTDVKRVELELRQRTAELEAAHRDLQQVHLRMKSDLDAAARIQRSLLPRMPVLESVQTAWRLRPCDELAGDSLNIFTLDESHLGFYVLDVSGHGISVSLLSVTVHRLLAQGPNSFIRDHCHAYASLPSEILMTLNEQFVGEETEQYFTIFFGVLDLDSMVLTYANAGHPGPLLTSASSPGRTLKNSSYPIGVVHDARYEDKTEQMRLGDRLWVYSDGLLEARNTNDEQFGRKRLDEAIRVNEEAPLHSCLEAILAAVEDWAGPTGPQDDISLLAIGLPTGFHSIDWRSTGRRSRIRNASIVSSPNDLSEMPGLN